MERGACLDEVQQMQKSIDTISRVQSEGHESGGSHFIVSTQEDVVPQIEVANILVDC